MAYVRDVNNITQVAYVEHVIRLIDQLADCYINQIENNNIAHALWWVDDLHEGREEGGLRAVPDDDNWPISPLLYKLDRKQ